MLKKVNGEIGIEYCVNYIELNKTLNQIYITSANTGDLYKVIGKLFTSLDLRHIPIRISKRRQNGIFYLLVCFSGAHVFVLRMRQAVQRCMDMFRDTVNSGIWRTF